MSLKISAILALTGLLFAAPLFASDHDEIVALKKQVEELNTITVCVLKSKAESGLGAGNSPEEIRKDGVARCWEKGGSFCYSLVIDQSTCKKMKKKNGHELTDFLRELPESEKCEVTEYEAICGDRKYVRDSKSITDKANPVKKILDRVTESTEPVSKSSNASPGK